MKKLFIILVVMMAIFALASCKQDPKEEATPAVENGGVITVRVGEGAEWNSSGRFQFFLDESITEDDTIEFLIKMSDTFSQVVVRSSDSTALWPKYATITVTPEMLNEDGWYVISTLPDGGDPIVAKDSCDALGISAMLKSGEAQTDALFVQIKNLKINGTLIDFSKKDADTYVLPFAGALAPSTMVVTIE